MSTPQTPQYEHDRNGSRSKREEVFQARTRPPTPAALERARGLAWYTEQLEALSEGLWNYQGPDVYGKIFRQYCRETGLLNTLNVTEILTEAAQLK
jgi:hypothetical protein